MIKFLFLADTHLGFDYPINPKVSRRRRGNDFFNNFQHVLDYAVNNNVDYVLHGGDFFFRSKVPSPIVDKAYTMLYKFAENNIPTIIVPGNHERSILPSSFLTSHKNIYILDEPKTYFFKNNHTSIAISGFPNVRENIRDNFENLLNQAVEGNPFSDIKMLLLHQSIEESKVENFTFRYGKDVIPQKLLPQGYDAILSGHIHRAQIIPMRMKNDEVPIIYPGSIERTSVAEINEEKGFYILEFDKNAEEEWNLSKIEFIKLPTRQMAKLDVTLLTEDKDTIRNWLEIELSKFDEDAVIRMRCNVSQTRKLLTAKFLRKITPDTMTLTLAPIYRKRK